MTFLSTLKKKRQKQKTSKRWSSSDGESISEAGESTATTGCLCCGSNVSYPQTVSCFKCTVCDTINDLQPLAITGAPPLTLSRLKQTVAAYKRQPETSQPLLEAMLRESFSNWHILNQSFIAGGVDWEAVTDGYKLILGMPPPVIRAMMQGTEKLLRRPGRPLTAKEDVRYLLIILENPLLLQQTFPQESSYHHHIVKSLVGILANLSGRVHQELALWISQQGRSSLRRKVQLVNQFISYRLQKYDRAWQRSNQNTARRLNTYSAQSNQQELPAFQRSRSSTNAPVRRPRGHSRMRSNTDSRISHSQKPAESKTKKDDEKRISASISMESLSLNESPGLIRNRSVSETPPQMVARRLHRKHMVDADDDYYVGADGVFNPRTTNMHQHDWRLTAAAKTMALLFAANQLLPTRARLALDVFYNRDIDRTMDLISDYDSWQTQLQPQRFNFCQYPLLLSLPAKVQILEMEAGRQMDSKVKEAVISAMFRAHQYQNDMGREQPHLKLFVRRHCLVEDSLNQLSSHENDLKKRLKIEFAGEEGIDQGGLTKEWFMLLVRELMNPMNGMFVRDEGSSAVWFNPASLESSNQYFLVGVVAGLALYNSTILDVNLPLAVFKKLLRSGFYQTSNKPSGIYGSLSSSSQLKYQVNEMLADVSEFRPQVARGLRQLLQYRKDDVEEVFGLTFEVTQTGFGEHRQVPLTPNGQGIPVTLQNRAQYVLRYLQWILNESVARQFEPFRRGFYYVSGSNALSLFRPEEIELMVQGSGEDWDPQELRRSGNVRLVGDISGELVKWFWEILSEWGPHERRLFLAFVTGTDRVPTALVIDQGLELKLALLGDDYGRLPIAHTCFNQLGIWRYRTKREFRERLWLAVSESEGFGLK